MKRTRDSLAIIVSMAIAIAVCVLSVSAQPRRDQMVALETTKGRILIRVFYSMVPYTASRFLDLVDNGFYNGLSFHRVENWVIQGGDPNGNGSGVLTDDNGRPVYLNLETHPGLTHNSAGMVAMARSAHPNSASCQFYITKCPMPQLNGKYAVFGQVVGGANAVMNMRPGDRIISAAILQPEGARAESSDEEAVPGYKPDPPAATAPVVETPPPKPKPPARYSLPGKNKAPTPDPAKEQQAQQQQQETKKPAKPEKPADSGF